MVFGLAVGLGSGFLRPPPSAPAPRDGCGRGTAIGLAGHVPRVRVVGSSFERRDDNDGMGGSWGYHRTGRAVLGLFIVVCLVMVMIWRKWGHEAVGTTTTIVSFAIVVAEPLRRRLSRGGGGLAERTPEAMADEFANAVRDSWTDEILLRRVTDVNMIPVHWEAAEADLVADWAALERVACSAGWPEPERTRWAAGPAGLAGGDGDLAAVLAKVPTGRLVVLGDPGAGKTILVVRLVLDLLEPSRRRPGGPVPVLVPLASWDPTVEGFWPWFERRLCLAYPGLRYPAPGRPGVKWARALWEAGLLLPVLDGLDEIVGPRQGRALAEVNEALLPGVGLVLTARTGSYREAVGPDTRSAGVLLSGAAGVALRPLDPAVVAAYLRASAGGPGAQARWDRVLAPDVLADPSHPVGQALATPLMVALARAVYSPRPGEQAADLQDPNRLLGRDLATRASVERHLIAGFVRAAYRQHPEPTRSGQWDPADAQRWLAFLARDLERRGTTDLAWWELHTALPRVDDVVRIAFGLVYGLGVGLAFWLAGQHVAWLVFGLLAGIQTGRVLRSPGVPARGWHFSPGHGLAGGLLGGIAGGLNAGFGAGPWAGLAVGLAFGAAVGLVVGLRPRPVEPAEAADPRTVLAQDRSAFRSLVFVVGLGGGLAAGVVAWFGAGPWAGLVEGLGGGRGAGLVVGPGLGLAVGLVVGLRWAACVWFTVTRWWLALRGRLPWRLMGFLADAHRRAVLRQAGPAYQFRHVELQRYLADQR